MVIGSHLKLSFFKLTQHSNYRHALDSVYGRFGYRTTIIKWVSR